VFTAVALLFTSQVWVDYAYTARRLAWGPARPLSWPRAFAVALIDWDLWALLAPAVIFLTERAPISRRHWLKALGVHLPASALLSMLKLIAESLLVSSILGRGQMPITLLKLYVTYATYWAIVVAARVAEQQRIVREREVRGAQLETELAKAHLEALKMQLHPHFLFNTLNTISGLMREDVEAADVMLAQLSDLLRRTLDTEGRHEVTLEEEIRWLQTYLAIQQTRYGPRLKIDVDVPTACGQALVPTLILQPLVENAIRHGFSVTPGPGAVAVRASTADSRLRLDVTDEGPGVVVPLREGYGLRNTRSRLAAMYGGAASLRVEARGSGHGTLSRIELPLRVNA
jgi:two-component system, LytTR family, sensor kinase